MPHKVLHQYLLKEDRIQEMKQYLSDIEKVADHLDICCKQMKPYDPMCLCDMRLVVNVEMESLVAQIEYLEGCGS